MDLWHWRCYSPQHPACWAMGELQKKPSTTALGGEVMNPMIGYMAKWLLNIPYTAPPKTGIRTGLREFRSGYAPLLTTVFLPVTGSGRLDTLLIRRWAQRHPRRSAMGRRD